MPSALRPLGGPLGLGPKVRDLGGRCTGRLKGRRLCLYFFTGSGGADLYGAGIGGGIYYISKKLRPSLLDSIDLKALVVEPRKYKKRCLFLLSVQLSSNLALTVKK